jgi:hypothetical protein
MYKTVMTATTTDARISGIVQTARTRRILVALTGRRGSGPGRSAAAEERGEELELMVGLTR